MAKYRHRYFWHRMSWLHPHPSARSLGFPDDHFQSMFEPNPLSTFRIIHYPSRVNFTQVPDEAKDGDTLITTGTRELITVCVCVCVFVCVCVCVCVCLYKV